MNNRQQINSEALAKETETGEYESDLDSDDKSVSHHIGCRHIQDKML